MADRTPPVTLDDERTTLLAFLDYLRDSVVRKADGLDETRLRWSPVPTGTSLLGLVKHLTSVEVVWFQHRLAGLDVELPSVELEPGDTVAGVLADYRAAVARSNEIVAGCPDLEQRCVRLGRAPVPLSLRWILVHMVEETARHAGHADIVREQLDGGTGR